MDMRSRKWNVRIWMLKKSGLSTSVTKCRGPNHKLAHDTSFKPTRNFFQTLLILNRMTEYINNIFVIGKVPLSTLATF